jgi:hypothetical protein
MNPQMTNARALREGTVTEQFLKAPDQESFASLFDIFTPQLVAFFRSRGCELELSEDLTQEVMLTVYRKASQIRDRSLFRAWLRDDGIGIDASVLSQQGRPGHFGLKGMRERSKRIGGQLDVWSECGAGTEVELTVPASVVYGVK